MSSNVDMQFSFLGVISMKIHCGDKDSALFSGNDPATKKKHISYSNVGRDYEILLLTHYF